MAARGESLRILLVESSEDDAVAVRRALEGAPMPCVLTCCACAAAARAAIREARDGQDVIVVADALPDMSGLALCRELLDGESARPVVMLIGSGAGPLAVEAMKAGVADCLFKDPGGTFAEQLPPVLVDAVRGHPVRPCRQAAAAGLREDNARLERQLAETAAQLEQARGQTDLALEALRGSEERYRGLVLNSPLGVIACDKEGHILTINDQIVNMLGVRRDDGAATVNLLQDPGLQEAGVTDVVRTCLQSGIAQTCEFAWRTPEGQRKAIRLHAAPMRDSDGEVEAVHALAEDITQRKQAEDALARSEAEARAIFATAADSIITIDETGIIQAFNGAAEQAFGFAPDEVLGQDLCMLIPAAMQEAHAKGLADYVHMGKAKLIGHGAREVIARRKDGTTFPLELTLGEVDLPDGRLFVGICRDVTERKMAEAERMLLATAVSQATESIVITDTRGSIEYVNDAFERVTGYTRAEVIGENPRLLKSGRQNEAFYRTMWRTIANGEVWHGHFENRRKDGTLYQEEAIISPVHDQQGKVKHYVAVKRDVTEQLAVEAKLRQAQKLEAVGALAAGIAHEINTPIQFIGDNTRFLQETFDDMVVLIRAYRGLKALSAQDGTAEPLRSRVADAEKEADIDYLLEEVPKAVEQTLDGVGRVAKIVRAMRDFAHPSVGDKQLVDLNRALETTLTVARNELKYVAAVETNFDPDLPEVACDLGELNQVFLNLFVNAAHAIADSRAGDDAPLGLITVTTVGERDTVTVQIGDTGGGIPVAVRERIFEPFFTTKEVGSGTGQGLAVARSVVVDKHGGTITFETEEGRGTTFTVRLPVRAPEADPDA